MARVSPMTYAVISFGKPNDDRADGLLLRKATPGLLASGFPLGRNARERSMNSMRRGLTKKLEILSDASKPCRILRRISLCPAAVWWLGMLGGAGRLGSPGRRGAGRRRVKHRMPADKETRDRRRREDARPCEGRGATCGPHRMRPIRLPSGKPAIRIRNRLSFEPIRRRIRNRSRLGALDQATERGVSPERSGPASPDVAPCRVAEVSPPRAFGPADHSAGSRFSPKSQLHTPESSRAADPPAAARSSRHSSADSDVFRRQGPSGDITRRSARGRAEPERSAPVRLRGCGNRTVRTLPTKYR